jgi:uncharacterized protein YraI
MTKLVRLALMAAAVATTVLMAPAAASAADSATATVQKSGGLAVMSAPSSNYHRIGTVANGATVTILCQTPGQAVTGTHGGSVIWSMLSTGGMVPNVNLSSGTTGYVTELCTYAGNPPRANPKTMDVAISLEYAQLGSTGQEGWCMRFQAQSYGWSHSGWSTAEVGGDSITSRGYMHTTGIPPRGALVWYHNSAGTGHVVVSLGEGKIIGSSVSGKVGVAAYNYRTGYRGWSVPYFPSAA